jgi:hypothetical protein
VTAAADQGEQRQAAREQRTSNEAVGDFWVHRAAIKLEE